MSGDRILLDTNIIIYHLQGDYTLESLLEGKYVFVSFISDIEIRSLKDISPSQVRVIDNFTSVSTIIHSSNHICKEAAALRRAYALKVPDAIIASTAICHQLPLITADKRFFAIDGLQTVRYIPS